MRERTQEMKDLSKLGIMAMTENISDKLKRIILSVDTMAQSANALDEVTKDMNPLEIILNIESIAKEMARITVENMAINQPSEKEKEVLSGLMQANMDIAEIYMLETVPSIRELSSIIIKLQVDLEEFSKLYKDNDKAILPDKDLYSDLLSLLNLRIISQR